MINDFEALLLAKKITCAGASTSHEVFAGMNYMSSHLVYSQDKKGKNNNFY